MSVTEPTDWVDCWGEGLCTSPPEMLIFLLRKTQILLKTLVSFHEGNLDLWISRRKPWGWHPFYFLIRFIQTNRGILSSIFNGLLNSIWGKPSEGFLAEEWYNPLNSWSLSLKVNSKFLVVHTLWIRLTTSWQVMTCHHIKGIALYRISWYIIYLISARNLSNIKLHG